MKSLLLKNTLLSLLAIMTISIFITSCGKETNEIETKIELSDADLVDLLTTNTSFTATAEIMNKMTADFNIFIENNQSLIERDPAVFDNYLSEYTEHKEAFIMHADQLLKDIPLFEQRDKEAVATILSNAFSIVNEASVDLRNPCYAACDAAFEACDDDAYAEYLFSRDQCVAGGGSYNYCNAVYHSYYVEAHGLCVSGRNFCLAQC